MWCPQKVENMYIVFSFSFALIKFFSIHLPAFANIENGEDTVESWISYHRKPSGSKSNGLKLNTNTNCFTLGKVKVVH